MPTYPGLNSIFQLDSFPMNERQAIMRFSQHFYITRAAQAVQVGNSNYRAFLMRPTEDISAVLNVEREIVVLFADYETFEARTLRAFDLTCDQFDDVRVDRSLRFLVSRDRNIETTIRHYLLQDPEYPIVIPFKYDDFRSATDDFIFNAIRRNYLIRDLFGYQSPLKHEYYFFGRKGLVESVLDRHKSGQNSSLFGLRKSGKTSTIYAIQRRAKTANCRTLVIDCQDPSIHARRFGPLLEYILLEIRRELNLKQININLGDDPVLISQNFQRLMNDSLNAAGQLCSQIHKKMSPSRPRGVSINACNEAERDAVADFQGYMRDILDNLRSFYPDEYAMLEYLSRGDTEKFNEMAEYSSTYVEHLIGYGLVIRRGEDYEFGFDAVAEVVKRSLIIKQLPTLEEKWTQIGSRRNILEQEIRGALYRWAVKLSDDDWTKSLVACVTRTRCDQLGAITRREAFSRNNSPLYFIELLKFVEYCGEFAFGAATSKSVSAAMDTINKYRADAHAKNISDEDYKALSNAFDLLEDVFLPPA
jgi:hypothetical protein